MKNSIYIAFILMGFQSCIETPQQEKLEVNDAVNITEQNVESQSEEEKTLTPKEEIPIHLFQKGETLWGIAERNYGNRHYSRVLAIYNEIENTNNIPAGFQIKIPELSFLLSDQSLGLYPLLHDEIEIILSARDLFMKHEETLWNLFRETEHPRGPVVHIDIEPEAKNDLIQAATLIDKAITSLRTSESFDSKGTPVKGINQLKNVSLGLKTLSEGNVDTYGYDLDMIHQNIVRVLMELINWAELRK